LFPQYEAIVGSIDFQFHSCQEQGGQRHPTAPQQQDVLQPSPQQNATNADAATNQQDITSSSTLVTNQQNNHFAPPPPRGEVAPDHKRVSMAF